MKRRTFTAAASSIALAALGTTPAWSQGLSNRPIRVVVAFAPGGVTDTVARTVGNYMSRHLGVPVLIENRPGANGNLGAMSVARAEPDGHTLLVLTMGMTIGSIFSKERPYDVLKDFTPVSPIVGTSLAVVSNPSLPIKTLPELMTYIKANPGKISYGSYGVGNSTHLTTHMLLELQKLEAINVPYKGSPPAYQDLMGGLIQFMTTDMSSALPLIKDGRLRALAVTGPQRVPEAPEVPTVQEALKQDFNVESWISMVAPAKTPVAVVEKLNAAITAALKDDAVNQRLKAYGARPTTATPERHGQILRSELNRWAKVIAESGATPE